MVHASNNSFTADYSESSENSAIKTQIVKAQQICPTGKNKGKNHRAKTTSSIENIARTSARISSELRTSYNQHMDSRLQPETFKLKNSILEADGVPVSFEMK